MRISFVLPRASLAAVHISGLSPKVDKASLAREPRDTSDRYLDSFDHRLSAAEISSITTSPLRSRTARAKGSESFRSPIETKHSAAAIQGSKPPIHYIQGSSHTMGSRSHQELAQYVLEQSKNPTDSTNEAASLVEKPPHHRQLRKKRPIDWSEQFVYIDSDCDSDYHPSKRSRCGTEETRDRASPVRYIKREPGLDPSSEDLLHTGRRSSLWGYGSWDNDSTRVEAFKDTQTRGTTGIEQYFQKIPPVSTIEARDDLVKKRTLPWLSEDRESKRPLSKHAAERVNGVQDVPVQLPASVTEGFQPQISTPAPVKADEPAIPSNTMSVPDPKPTSSSVTESDIPSKEARTDLNTAVNETINGLPLTTKSEPPSLPNPEYCSKGTNTQETTPSSPLLPMAVLRVPMQIDDDVRAIEASCPSLSAGSWMIVKSAMQQGVVNLDQWQSHDIETIHRSAPDKKIATAKSLLEKVFDIHEDMKTLSSDERLASWLKLTVDLVFTFPR